MPTPRLAILLGHSHAGSVIGAATTLTSAARPDRDPLHLAMFEAWKYDGQPPYTAMDADGAQCFNPAVLEAAKPYVDGLGSPSYIVSFGGNDWAVMSLMQHSEPFDFIYPGEPDLPFQDGAELMTLAYVKALLKSLTDKYNYLLYLLRKTTSNPIYAFLPPPPIGDNIFIEQKMDDFFRKAENFTLKVSNKYLRRKMWLLQRDLQEKICRENGITLLEVPPDAITDDGFLSPSCYGRDATHAGPVYGRMVLDQLEEAMNVNFHTYHWFGLQD